MRSSLGGHLGYFQFFCVNVHFHFFEYRPRSGLVGLRVTVWRRKWHLTPVLLPGKSHGWRGLMGYSPWGLKESDTTEWLHFHFSLKCIGEGNGNPLQCSCLENPRDGGAWWAAVCGVAQSLTQLKWLSSSSSRITVCLTVWESAKLLCSVAVPSRIPTSDMEVPRFSTSPPALDAVSVFMIAILVGGKWHLIVVLTCAFRVTDASVIRSVTSDSLWPHGL